MTETPLMRAKHGLCLTAVVSVGLVVGLGELRAAAPDLDGDGIPNIVDPDIDNDGLPNALDKNVDGGIARSGPYEGQYIGDHLANDNPAEHDIDGDDLADDSLGETDIDGDSLSDGDALEDDTDGDGRPNGSGAERDMDGDGRRDHDDNEDDQDGDGEDDREDRDDDNDGEEDEDDPDHHPEADEIEVEEELMSTGDAPAGSEAKVEVQRFGSGKIELKVEAAGLAAGRYDILVAGVMRGALVMVADDGETEGETEFETDPNKPDELNLDFELFGLELRLEQGGTVLFHGTIPSPPEAPGNVEGDSERDDSTDVDLVPAAGVFPEAEGHAEAGFGLLGGVVRLEIEVEKIPAGDYDLRIGGVRRATLTVVADGDDSQGRVVFDAESDDPEKLPLAFAAAGESIVVSQSGVLVFSGVIPASPEE